MSRRVGVVREVTGEGRRLNSGGGAHLGGEQLALLHEQIEAGVL